MDYRQLQIQVAQQLRKYGCNAREMGIRSYPRKYKKMLEGENNKIEKWFADFANMKFYTKEVKNGTK